MNEQDESEMAVAPTVSPHVAAMPDAIVNYLSGSSDAPLNRGSNYLRGPVNLPAALITTSFLPHARGTGSLKPQCRRLPIVFLSRHIFCKISGSVGQLDHPTCCLHISGPVRPRQCLRRIIHSTYERGRTIKTAAGK